MQEFDAAIKINPKYAIAHNNRGEAFENMNQLEDAMAAYNRAIEINPRYARAYRQPRRHLAQDEATGTTRSPTTGMR